MSVESPVRWISRAAIYLPAAALPALALGILALAGRGPGALRRRQPAAVGMAVGAALVLARWQLGRFFTEQPDYTVERVVDGIEIRRYRPHVVAETTVEDADWDRALREGFRRLAGYIFGGNDAKQRIAMSAPVTSSHGEERGYSVVFVMPKARELASLPTPRDPRVRLREAPGERRAVLRYHGTYRGDRARAKHVELLERVRAAGLEPRGEPVFAGYDAPSTLPFLRRLEAWVPLA